MIINIKNLYLFDIIKNIYISEKSNFLLEKSNILVFKVNNKYNKIDIKRSIVYFFNLKIKKINVCLVKKKKNKKIKNNKFGYSKLWKKVYVILESNQKKIFLNKLNEINSSNIIDYEK
ncbi:50S ribosomal protein L23 [endosymbiont of Euscepes postfasciatus]|uniref:50S ribosomal protein L23 n=1 Tax=endosymbiont of Euscepes postfasciatus TaxID=650377 RepID=UPI000DC6DAAB|nr:50S ribosomal protein L23 [endosymbiont of Euscepes postfasciatus]BBA84691.1 50S ribosomal protein L23 [endosymbiont of Euscepes postfasciatus]